MGDLKNIYAGIRTALKNNSAVAALVSDRIYSQWRPGTASTFPRVHLAIVSDYPINDQDTLRGFRLQVSAFAADRDQAGAENVCEAARAVLEAGGITFTGWTNYSLFRDGGRAVGIDNEGIAHWADDYILFLS